MALGDFLSVLGEEVDGHFSDLATVEVAEIGVTELDGVDDGAGDEGGAMAPEKGFVGRDAGEFLEREGVDGFACFSVGGAEEKTGGSESDMGGVGRVSKFLPSGLHVVREGVGPVVGIGMVGEGFASEEAWSG